MKNIPIKALCACCAAALCLSLVSCGGKESSAPTEPTATAQASDHRKALRFVLQKEASSLSADDFDVIGTQVTEEGTTYRLRQNLSRTAGLQQ